MKAQCLPFTQIPHTTKLFADFLYDFPKVSRFYSRTPHYNDWLREQAKTISYDLARRQQVAAVLSRQNRTWGASEATHANIAKFASGAFAAVTGQQVGLFGGPLFTIFKVLSAVKLAERATGQGIPTVPVFWLATSDHDLAEINHTFVSAANSEPQRIDAPTQGTVGASVGGIQFGKEILPAVEQIAALLGEGDAMQWLRAAYRPGETFGSAFARFYAQVFGSLGVVVIDPDDAELHNLASPIYSAAVEHAVDINEALLQRGQELTRAGYHEQVKVTPSSTTLFAIHSGARTAIHRTRANGDGEFFEIGSGAVGVKLSGEVLLQGIVANPSDFSPNALLRPIVQDSLLPTLAYVGGPAEVAYFAQSAVLYEKLLGRITPILPRFSATIIDSKQSALLDRYGLSLTSLYAGPDAVRNQIATRTLPPEVQSEFEKAQRAVAGALDSVKTTLERLDPTLTDAAVRAGRKIRYQLARLRQRAANAELRRKEILARHAALLSNTLFPDRAPQERQLAAAQFLARFGTDLQPRILENVNPDCLDHQLLFWE
jgi:bacillithiol synthase